MLVRTAVSILFLWVVIILGCGPVRSKKNADNASFREGALQKEPPDAREEHQAVRNWNLRLVPEGEARFGDLHHNRPDYQQSSGHDRMVYLGSNRVLFRSPISMRSETNSQNSLSNDASKRLYFVWPKSFSGKSILEAKYSHKTLNQQNRWVNNSFQVSSFVDGDHWYIPLDDLFRSDHYYSFPNINVGDLQSLVVTLLLEDLNTIQFEIIFKAIR